MTLPSNELAEKATIGVCLLGGQRVALDAFAKLSDDCFFTAPWDRAWLVIKKMSEDGTPIDGLTFLNEWRKLTSMRLVESMSLVDSTERAIPVDSAMMEAPTAHNLDYWVDELTALSERRAAMLGAASLSADLNSGKTTPSEASGRLEGILGGSNLDRSDVLDSSSFVRIGIEDVEKRHRAHQTGYTTALKSGLPDLDRITGGFEPGELVIVGALSSIGKSAFAVTLAENFTEPVLFISCEMTPASLYRRYVAVHSRVRARNLKEGSLVESDFKAMHGSNADLQRKRFACVDGVAGITIDEIKAKVVTSVRRNRTRIVIVDYLQKVRPGKSSREKRHLEVSDVSEGLQAIARKQNVLVIALSQLNRDVRKAGRRPTVADLSDSSQIEKDADLIILLHREPDGKGGFERATSACVAKSRDGETDMCELYFNAEFTRFESAARKMP